MSTRESLPFRRKSLTHSIKVDGTRVHFTVGFYSDGRVGELWVDMHKFGSSLRSWVGKTARLFSVLLQHGVSLEEACKQLIAEIDEPKGSVEGSQCVKSCTSVMDAIGKELLCVYADSAINLTTLAVCAERTTAKDIPDTELSVDTRGWSSSL